MFDDEITGGAPGAPTVPSVPSVPSVEPATQPAHNEATEEVVEETPADDEASQIASIDDDFAESLEEVEETDVPEHMRSQEEPNQPEAEKPEGEAAPAQEPESPQAPTEPTKEGEEKPEEGKQPDTPQPEKPAAEEPKEPAPTEPETTQQPPTPEEVANQRAEWRASAEQQLAEGHFKMPQELVEEFEESPETAIPKLASKLYLDAIEGATYAISSQLPQMIENINRSQNESQRLEQQFFEMWPMLDQKNQAHVDAARVQTINFRQANPNASAEEIMQHAGAATVIALKLPVGGPQTPAAPEQPASPAPHQPIGGAAPAGAPGNSQRGGNQFEQLDEDLDAMEGEL